MLRQCLFPERLYENRSTPWTVRHFHETGGEPIVPKQSRGLSPSSDAPRATHVDPLPAKPHLPPCDVSPRAPLLTNRLATPRRAARHLWTSRKSLHASHQ